MYRSGYYPIPADEAVRLARIDDYGVFDRPAEREFDQITRLGAKLFDVSICLVSIMGRDRQWFAACTGARMDGTPRDMAFCSRTIMATEPLIVLDLTQDVRFRDNPFVTGEAALRFYAGAPIIVEDGVCLGALCLLDTRPRERFDARQIALLVDLSSIVAERLMLRRQAGQGRRDDDQVDRLLAEERREFARQAEEANARQVALRGVIDDIDALSKEAKMLALNCAIEAARQGEDSNAFAAVASEMKKLASHTRDAARCARGLLG